MTRRQPGTGTIDRLPSGRYRWRLTLADGNRIQRTCVTEEEARLELDGAREVYSGGAVPVSALSLGSYGSRWLDVRRTANADTERSLWRHHVLGTPLADVPVKEIQLRQIKRWAESLLRKQFESRAGQGVTDDRDLHVTSEELAQQFVIEVARGRRGDPEGLALAVLREVAGLAMEVLDGGEHQIARALDLAEQILDRAQKSKLEKSEVLRSGT